MHLKRLARLNANTIKYSAKMHLPISAMSCGPIAVGQLFIDLHQSKMSATIGFRPLDSQVWPFVFECVCAFGFVGHHLSSCKCAVPRGQATSTEDATAIPLGAQPE